MHRSLTAVTILALAGLIIAHPVRAQEPKDWDGVTSAAYDTTETDNANRQISENNAEYDRLGKEIERLETQLGPISGADRIQPLEERQTSAEEAVRAGAEDLVSARLDAVEDEPVTGNPQQRLEALEGKEAALGDLSLYADEWASGFGEDPADEVDAAVEENEQAVEAAEAEAEEAEQARREKEAEPRQEPASGPERDREGQRPGDGQPAPDRAAQPPDGGGIRALAEAQLQALGWALLRVAAWGAALWIVAVLITRTVARRGLDMSPPKHLARSFAGAITGTAAALGRALAAGDRKPPAKPEPELDYEDGPTVGGHE